jgi:heptosyltransferase-1
VVTVREAIIDIGRNGDVSSILIVRLFALGDIVLTLPLVRAIRKNFPGAWIGYLVKERYAGALAGDTGLDEVIGLPDGIAGQMSVLRRIRGIRPDVAIDLLSSPRSAMITRFCGAGLRIGMDTGRRNGYYDEVLPRAIFRDGKRVRCYTAESNLETGRMLGLDVDMPGWGTDTGDRPYGFPAAEGEAEWADSFISSIGDRENGFAGIVPFSTYPSKGWPIDRFIDLAEMIATRLRVRPVIIWGPGEEVKASVLSIGSALLLPPPTDIARAGALIGRLKVLVGIDSGPKHIAVLQGVPTVTLFGPTDPRIWDPMNGRHRAVWKGLECAEGCREKSCTPNRCMEMITVDEVFEEVRSVIGGRT